MIAVMDTALFKSGKEGYVIDENGIYSGKLMLENSAIGKPISFIAFNELEKVEVDSSNKSHCILTYTNGDTKIAYNTIYNEYIVRILNNICKALHSQEENSTVDELTKRIEELQVEVNKILDQIDNEEITDYEYEYMTEVKPVEGQFLFHDQEYKNLHQYVNELYKILDIDYKIRKNTDIETITKCMNEAERIFKNESLSKQYHLLKEGYADYVYLVKEKRKVTPERNHYELQDLGFTLIVKYKEYKNPDYLKMAALCFILNYQNGKEDGLQDLVECGVKLAYYYSYDIEYLLDIVEACDNLYSVMVEKKLYAEGETHILICDGLSNFFLEFAEAMEPKDPTSQEDWKICLGDYTKAAFYKSTEALLRLAKIYSRPEFNDEAKAIQLLFERDMILLTTKIIDEPLGIDSCFDAACEGYNNLNFGDCCTYFELASTYYGEETNNHIFAASYYNLGLLFLRSIEDYENYQEATLQFCEALSLGLNEAGFMLCILYLNGIKDETFTDERCYHTLASLPYVYKGIYAHYMAKCHREGIGTIVDLEKAESYEKMYVEYYKNELLRLNEQ